MTIKHVLARAVSRDSESKTAWEGLALLVAAGETVVVLRDRTNRPMTLSTTDCYVRLLPVESAFFYGWLGLGCAMRAEEEGRRWRQARAAGDSNSSSNKASTGGEAPAAAAAPPLVSYPVLYGKRPYEAKDCFARAAMICPWAADAWAQLLTAMGPADSSSGSDGIAPVEVDPPCDEQELAAILLQREAIRGGLAAGNGGASTTARTATTVATATTTTGRRGAKKPVAKFDRERRIQHMADRLLQESVVTPTGNATATAAAVFLTFAEVASVALELNGANPAVWRYVGAQLGKSGSGGGGGAAGGTAALRRAGGVRARRAPAATATAAAAAGPPSAALPGRVYVGGSPYTAAACAKVADDLERAAVARQKPKRR